MIPFFVCVRFARSYLAAGRGIIAPSWESSHTCGMITSLEVMSLLPGDILAFGQNSMVKNHKLCPKARALVCDVPNVLKSLPHSINVLGA